MARVRLFAAVVALLAASVQCTGPLDPQPLHRFSTCDEMERFIEDRVLDDLHAQQAPSPWLWGCPFCACQDEAIAAGDAAEGEGEGARTFTTTNTQEIDVDEPDLVKNDGDTIFVLSQRRLYVVDAWPPADLSVTSTVEIAGAPIDMLRAGDHLLVTSRTDEGTHVTLVDVGDPAAPRVLRKTAIEGDLLDSRRVGDEVMLVTRSFVKVPALPDRRWFHDDDNRAEMKKVGLDGMFPRLTDQVIGEDESPRTNQAASCSETFAADNTHAGDMGVVLVHAIDIADASAPILSSAVIAPFAHVYASTESIWLAAPESHDGGFFTPPFQATRIHHLAAFEGTGACEYRATGLFYGTIKDELSLDEEDGRLRMVISDDGESLEWGQGKTSLRVIEEQDDQLIEVARVDDIGKGEVVEAVRFLGKRAYVVTFPQAAHEEFLDPLHVIDLSAPTAPVLAGTLEVEGYAAYIHPLDDEHLVTVGVDADTQTGIITSLKLQTFDVANAKKPEVLDTLSFGDGNTRSEALNDRHAFTFFAEEKLLAIPVVDNDAQVTSRTAVFHVDVDDGIREVGSVAPDDVFGDASAWPLECRLARRTVIIHDPDAGTYVYAVSRGAVAASRVDEAGTLDDALAGSVLFLADGAQECIDAQDDSNVVNDGGGVE